MAEDNNQQPDFSQLVEALKIQNEEATAAKEQAELTAGLTSALKNENLEIGDAQRKQMEANSLSPSESHPKAQPMRW